MSNHSKIASSINDAYFTPEQSVKFCHSHLYVRDWVGYNKTVLEPCVGSGRLVKGLPGVIFGADIKSWFERPATTTTDTLPVQLSYCMKPSIAHAAASCC